MDKIKLEVLTSQLVLAITYVPIMLLTLVYYGQYTNDDTSWMFDIDNKTLDQLIMMTYSLTLIFYVIKVLIMILSK